jgi:hypothetical protein
MRKILLSSLLILVSEIIFSQAWMQYLPASKPEKEITFYDYQDAFEEWCSVKGIENGYYMVNGEKTKAGGWKQFKRWEIEMQGLYDIKTGEIYTPNLWKEYRRIQEETLTRDSYTGDWVCLGYDDSPGGYHGQGRLNCIGFHPTDANTFWVGAANGGVWKTTNHGATWTPISDNLAQIGISNIIIPPDFATSNTMYIGTGDRGDWWGGGVGILKSTDGGTTWTETDLGVSSPEEIYIGKIIIHPSDPLTQMAATKNGIYKTTNGWVNASQVLSNFRGIDMEYHPTDPQIIYAVNKTYYNGETSTRIIRSTNGGANWSDIKIFDNSVRVEISISPAAPDRLYALVAGSDNGLKGIYRSDDAGLNWELTFDGSLPSHNLLGWVCSGNDVGGQGSYDLAMAVNPLNADEVFIGGVNVWRSTNGGYNWAIKSIWTGNCGGSVATVHADHHWLEFQYNTTKIFSMNDGGIYYSVNNGQHWTEISNGLIINQLYYLSCSQQNYNEIIMGLQDNSSKLWIGGNFLNWGDGDGTNCLIHPKDNNVQYRTSYGGLPIFTTAHWVNAYTFQVTNDSTTSWEKAFCLDPTFPDTVYFGLTNLWRSYQNGHSFSLIFDPPYDNSRFHSIAVAPSNSDIIFALNSENLYKSEDHGNTWSELGVNLPGYPDDLGASMIRIHNTNPLILWLVKKMWGNSCKVYKSTDGGSTWNDFGQGLPPDILFYDLVQNKLVTDHDELYLAGLFGVYLKQGDQPWVNFSNGLPNTRINDLDIYYDGNNSKLRAGTYGRGFWETSLYGYVSGTQAIWTGLQNTSWHDHRNWLYMEVPTGSEDVVIPSNTPYSPAVFYEGAICKSLVINPNAQLFINGRVLTVVDSLEISGTLRMTGPGNELEVDGDIRWKGGSSFNATTSLNNKIRVYGDWIVTSGSYNLEVDSADVYFMGNEYSTIHNHGDGFKFGNLNILKSPGKAVIFDIQSTKDVSVSRNLTITSGASLTHNSSKNLKISGNLTANGNLYFQAGDCILNGDNANIYLGISSSFFNNLEINANSGKTKTMTSNILIGGNLKLAAGTLNMGDFDLKLTGDLVKTGGNLLAGSGKFIFRGSDRQTVTGSLIIPYLELAKPSDTLLLNNHNLICNKYDWTEGTIAVTGFGSFMVSDLEDDGIYGSFYLNNNGEISLTQDASQSVNLNGIIRIEGGNFTVNGGSGTSNWPGAVNSELWISDGLLDFKNQGIHLSNSAYLLEVITGGVIRTSKSFTSERNDFTPIGGRIELFGSGNADLSHGIGGAFWDVRLFKTGTVSAVQNLTVDNSLTLVIGTFDINGKTVHVENLLDIGDVLKMTLPSSQLSVNGDVIWKSGSSADISEGTIAFKGNWYFNTGTSAQLAGNNTVKATSVTTNQYIYHKDSDACFANFSLEKPFVSIQRHLILDNSSDNPMRVNGNLTLLSNNSMRVDFAEMIVGGNVQANSNSFIRAYETGSITTENATIDGVLNLFGGAFSANNATIGYGLVMTGNASAELSNLTLNGTIDLDDGSLVVHNNFSQSSGGHLILDGGSFILDKPYTGNLFGFAGTTDLNGGFFEISYEGIQFGTGATVNFNGGTLRVGGHFRAVNTNSFQPSSGTVELINTIGANIEVTNGNYFHRLVINKSGYNPCFPIHPLTVNDQMVLQQGEYYTFNQGLTIGDDLIIESLGKLTAGSAEIYVGGDWINNRGTAGFVENTSSVWLTPAQTSTISSETFNELVIQASTTPGVYASMAPNSTITVKSDFVLSEGALLMNENCTLNANSVVFIKNNGGLNANPDATGTVINCLGHWWDYNTVANAQRSFTCGQSTVNFKGASDQQVLAYPGAVFNHLNIQKTGGNLLPSHNITVLGDMNLQSGSWIHTATGLTNTFKGHFNISSGAAWLDNQNMVSFEGSLPQNINNNTGDALNFATFRVNRPAGLGPGYLTINSDINCNSANFMCGNVSMTDHNFDCQNDMNILENATVEFYGNTTIRMANNKLINVDGGSLLISGDEVNQPLVTRLSTGYYKIQVYNGGLMNAEYATFEYLHMRGIEFGADGGVFGDQPFNYCTMRDGISGGILFYMSSASDITLHNVNFPLNTWGGIYNVAKYENAGNVFLPGAIGGFAGPTFEYDPHNRIHWPSIGIWEGDESTEWHDLHNWRYDFQVPDINTDVVIPSGVTYYPDFHQVETTVSSIRVDANASLTISKDSLTVLNTTDIAGALNLTADYTVLFTDSLVWQAGSSASLATRANIMVSGNMFIRQGSNLHLDLGSIRFYGNGESSLICHDTAQINGLYNDKNAPFSLSLVGDTLAQLTVNGAFRNGPGATLKCPSTQEWIFKGHLRNTDNGHYRCQNGTIRLAGAMPATYFRPNQGDYFNNLIIETTSALNLYNTYSDTLRIRGNLTINPSAGTSSLTANNFKIMMWGDWINNVGTSGFNAGTGEVWFWHSSNPQSISGNTVFNELYAHNNPNGLSINGNNTVDDLLVVLYPLHVNGNLTANVVNIDDSPSELHLYNGCYMQAGTLIQGGVVHAHGGTFMVNDLNEDGVFGVYIVDNGLVVLGQEEYYTSHDFTGFITINGGELRFTGGGGSSAWPANIGGSYANLTMTGGLFYLQNHGVEIRNNSFTENMTGGTIRVNHGFYCTAGVTTFTPTGGAVEIVTPDDAGVSILHPDSYFWDLIINNGDYGGATYPSSNFKVKNELKVLSGMFHIDGFEITVGP